MREIKFRAWHKTWSPKEIDKSDWHTEGQKINGMQAVKSLGHSTHGNFWVHLANWSSACNANEVELMQFTGLCDKNGKEIYEGDIVESKRYPRSYIIFEDGSFILSASSKDIDAQRWVINHFEIEIIGNIYENPELVKSATV